MYDESGAPIGFKYRTPSYAEGEFDCYFFEKNLQGDIIAIYNEVGTKIGTYTYDAWGNCTITSNTTGYNFILYNNPFRYRGYYYDTETGLYYLQSRYYNPTWGRFINADSYVSTGQGLLGYNMFAYCNNNPVMYVDYSGDFPWFAVVIVIGSSLLGMATGATVGNIHSSNLDVENIDVEPMDKEKYLAIEYQDFTYGLSTEEKIAYIRRLREDEDEIAKNWTEAQMLREFNYHDRGYELAILLGSDPTVEGSLAFRFKHVDFEKKQTFKTYLFRTVGNFMFW